MLSKQPVAHSGAVLSLLFPSQGRGQKPSCTPAFLHACQPNHAHTMHAAAAALRMCLLQACATVHAHCCKEPCAHARTQHERGACACFRPHTPA